MIVCHPHPKDEPPNMLVVPLPDAGGAPSVLPLEAAPELWLALFP